jgi:hypothetical protein
MAVAILAANNILAITFSLKNQLDGTTQIVLNKNTRFSKPLIFMAVF